MRFTSRFIFALTCAMSMTACVTELQVSRHSSIDLDDQEAIAILNDFSAVISVADSAGDFDCATDFGQDFFSTNYVMDGNVGIYTGPSVINSQEDFTAVITQPGYVKVVSAINWCGDFGANIIGCAPIPGDSFVVVRRAASLEGILWAHEFGHTVGLEHSNNNQAVMRGTIGSNNRDITAVECTRFSSKTNIDLLPSSNVGEAASVSSPISGKASRQFSADSLDGVAARTQSAVRTQELLDFVRKIYPHGTPMAELAEFENNNDNAESLATLAQMLTDPAQQPYWGNVVVALGMLGGSDMAPTLIRFANEQYRNNSSVSGLGDTTAALMALGYLANRTGDQAATQYLQSAINPSSWLGSAEQQRQLATAAHIGAAFSGSPISETAARSSSVVSTALAQELQQMREQIASVGIAAYYRNRR